MNLFKREFEEKKEGLGLKFRKFACLFRQMLHLVLFHIDLEMSKL